MLVLTRKAGESIVINGNIQIVVVAMEGNKCQLGVVAPRAVSVHREEVHEKIKAHRGNSSTHTFGGDITGNTSLAADLEAANVPLCGGDLVLDFTNVRRVNSLDLGTLVELHKRLESQGDRLTLVHMDANVREVFAVTRLDTYLTIAAGP